MAALEIKLVDENGYKYNEFDVCINPTKISILDNDNIKCIIEVSSYNSKWYFGYTIMLKDAGCGCPCSINKLKEFDNKNKAILNAIDKCMKYNESSEEIIKKLEIEKKKREFVQLTLF